ncbi:uncharacterized membrane protein C3orf80 [Thalassophryne amazonica]|uniref:uncharacterized membrane protein C3orf80 n=1 Tax=Thalassophryne amazonica TaxID=390379 RepID=UPI001470C17A|nr:uncharacterized membrane protein C3orf80 [Thalassophryne amazonica]XP_034024183.1 uncharacterized membrane protein C3orf80 [Thalassophryne amazonica]
MRVISAPLLLPVRTTGRPQPEGAPAVPLLHPAGMMPRLAGGGGTFLSACLLSACQALRSCGEVQCGDGQQCCPPIDAGHGNGSSAVRCCKMPIHVFFDNVGWFTRKLSGILILLLLFAMGYFIQRIICPQPRRHPHHERSDEPSSSLFHGHASASQDSLLDRNPEISLAGFTSLSLPAYDEVKYLPTYEESMQELRRDRSDDSLLSGNDERTVGVPGRVPGPQHSPRVPRNSV